LGSEIGLVGGETCHSLADCFVRTLAVLQLHPVCRFEVVYCRLRGREMTVAFFFLSAVGYIASPPLGVVRWRSLSLIRFPVCGEGPGGGVP